MCSSLCFPGRSTGTFHQDKTLGWLPWPLWQIQFGATLLVSGLETASASRGRQVLKGTGSLSTACSFYFQWIWNIPAKPGLKSQTRPHICWIPQSNWKAYNSPIKKSLGSWPLSQSFHVMTEISHSLSRLLAPEKSGHCHLSEEAYRKGAQPQLGMAQWYQSELIGAPWGASYSV